MSTITAATAEPYTTHLGDAWWYGDGLFEFLIPSEATGGLLTVFRATMPGGFSPPRHVHTREDEVFVVEDGELRFDIAGRAVAAGPGTSVFMPRGVPHAFRVDGPSARVLGIMTPAGSRACSASSASPLRAARFPTPASSRSTSRA